MTDDLRDGHPMTAYFEPEEGVEVYDALNDEWFVLTEHAVRFWHHEGVRRYEDGSVNFDGLILTKWRDGNWRKAL